MIIQREKKDSGPSLEHESFFGAMLGLLTDPLETSRCLLNPKRPPYVLGSVVFFFAVLFVPLIVQSMQFDFLENRFLAILQLCGALFAITYLFIFLECGLLRIIGIQYPIRKLTATCSYVLLIASPIILGYYIVDFFLHGQLSFATYILTGAEGESSKFINFLPYLLGTIVFYAMVTFYCGLQVVGGIGGVTAMLALGASSISAVIAVLFGFIGCSFIFRETFTPILQAIESATGIPLHNIW